MLHPPSISPNSKSPGSLTLCEDGVSETSIFFVSIKKGNGEAAGARISNSKMIHSDSASICNSNLWENHRDSYIKYLFCSRSPATHV